MVLAMVPAAPPTRKNQRATSWPAPISANAPYVVWSRLICNAFSCVLRTGRLAAGRRSRHAARSGLLAGPEQAQRGMTHGLLVIRAQFTPWLSAYLAKAFSCWISTARTTLESSARPISP